MPLNSCFLERKTSSTVQPVEGTGRRTFLKRSGLAASSMALLGNFPLGWLPKARAGNPPPARTADAGSAGAGPRPDAATTASRGPAGHWRLLAFSLGGGRSWFCEFRGVNRNVCTQLAQRDR